jgi:hypothetical protein
MGNSIAEMWSNTTPLVLNHLPLDKIVICLGRSAKRRIARKLQPRNTSTIQDCRLIRMIQIHEKRIRSLEVFYRHRQLGLGVAPGDITKRLLKSWDQTEDKKNMKIDTAVEKQALQRWTTRPGPISVDGRQTPAYN